MSTRTRFAAVATGAMAALGMSGNAIAAYTPKFTVNHAPHSVASATTTITIDVPRGDDATAKVTFYAPLGYRGVWGESPARRSEPFQPACLQHGSHRTQCCR